MKKAADALLMDAFYLSVGAFIYMGNAGWRMDARAWAFFAVHAPMALWIDGRRACVRERLVSSHTDTKWHQPLAFADFILTNLFLYAAAGQFSPGAPEIGRPFWIGIACGLLSAALRVWESELIRAAAIGLGDAPLETTVHCERGPFRVVRSPGAFARILWCVAAALIFGTGELAVLMVLCAILILVRVALSDRRTKAILPEYAEYARRVRWRVIPFLW